MAHVNVPVNLPEVLDATLMLLGSHKLIHYACSHRKNQFVKKLKRHAGKTLWAHTGTIDSCWGMMKDSVPDQLPTCKNDQSKLNDLIWTYVRAWQWRWQSHVHGQALLKKLDLTWRRCNVTSKMRCRCGFAANHLRNRSFFQVPNLQIMQKNTGEIVEHSGIDPENSHASSKKPCKTHDCQDSNYQKNAILHGRKTTRRDV